MAWIRIFPALFTRISMGPSCDSTARANCVTSAARETSAWMADGAASQLLNFSHGGILRPRPAPDN